MISIALQDSRLLPFFSVVVAARNEASYIDKCIDSILASDYPKQKIQVIVLVAPSTDATENIVVEYAHKYPSIVEYHRNEGVFAPHAFNEGIRYSSGDVIVILSAHAIISKNWFQAISATLTERPDAVGVGGMLVTEGLNFWGRAISLAMSCPFGVGGNSFRVGGKGGFVDTVVFGAYRRDIFRKVGLFDEEMIRNQDDEFNYRIIRNGDKLYFSPSIVSTYYSRGSLFKLWRQYSQYGFWKPLVYRKCPGVFALRQLAPPLFVLGLFVVIASAFSSTGFLYLLSFGLLCYCFLGVVISAVYLKRHFHLIPILPLIYLCMHTAYGLFFLKGMIRFWLVRR